MKNKIFIIIICLLMLTSCSKKNSNLSEPNLYINKIDEKEIFTQTNCDDIMCPVTYEITYSKIDITTNIDKLNKIIDEFNNNVEKYITKVNSSKLDIDEKCGNYDKTIYYSFGAYIYNNWNVTDDFIILSQQVNEINFCTNVLTSNKMKSYIYNQKTNEIITQEEYIKSQNINEDFLLKTINGNLAFDNYNKTIKSLDEVVLYKATGDSDLYFSFFDEEKNKYRTISVEVVDSLFNNE